MLKKQRKKQSSGSPLRVGQNVLVQTVLPFFTGRIVGVTEDEILLTQAAWIPDTGRYHAALRGTTPPLEVEPIPPDNVISIARGAVMAVLPWAPALPLEPR